MSCKRICKICKNLIISQSLTFSEGNLIIGIPEGSYEDGERVCIVVAQNLPTNTTINANVVIQIGNGDALYPVTKCDCAPLSACAIKSRTKYSMIVRTTVDSATFKLLGNISCKTDRLRAINGEGTAVAPGPTGGDA